MDMPGEAHGSKPDLVAQATLYTARCLTHEIPGALRDVWGAMVNVDIDYSGTSFLPQEAPTNVLQPKACKQAAGWRAEL